LRSASFLTMLWASLVFSTLAAYSQSLRFTDARPRLTDTTPDFETHFDLVGA